MIYTFESSNKNPAILGDPGIFGFGGLHICNPTLRKTGKKEAIVSLPYGRTTNTYSLLTKFPIPLYFVDYLDPNYVSRLTESEL